MKSARPAARKQKNSPKKAGSPKAVAGEVKASLDDLRLLSRKLIRSLANFQREFAEVRERAFGELEELRQKVSVSEDKTSKLVARTNETHGLLLHYVNEVGDFHKVLEGRARDKTPASMKPGSQIVRERGGGTPLDADTGKILSTRKPEKY